MPELPVLVVGDVHGDLERLFAALRPYPADEWHTVFLGDLVDGGPFGVGALRYARDRAHSDVLLGNHEVAMLGALRDRNRVASWLGLGGELHDLEELRKDEDLVEWLAGRPAVLKTSDGTLFQHADSDAYARLLDPAAEDPVVSLNRNFAAALRKGDFELLWRLLTPGHVFQQQPHRLDRWLERMDARRVVHGHKPHRESRPDVYASGKAINFDGGLSRFTPGARFRRRSGSAASVGPLPELNQGSPTGKR